jgi:hypothetical protein
VSLLEVVSHPLRCDLTMVRIDVVMLSLSLKFRSKIKFL